MLWHTVERPFDAVYSLQRSGQPWRNLGSKDDVWLGTSLERTSRGGKELLRHDDDDAVGERGDRIAVDGDEIEGAE